MWNDKYDTERPCPVIKLMTTTCTKLDDKHLSHKKTVSSKIYDFHSFSSMSPYLSLDQAKEVFDEGSNLKLQKCKSNYLLFVKFFQSSIVTTQCIF